MTGKVRSGRDGDRLARREGRQAGQAHEAGPAVDLGRARTALAGLAVPAHGQVARLAGLHVVDGVEDNLALVDRDGVVDEVAPGGVAPPDPQLQVVGHSVLLLQEGRQLGRGYGQRLVAHARRGRRSSSSTMTLRLPQKS